MIRSISKSIAYLLQRIEDFPGLVILSSNKLGKMENAFMRRFDATIHFTMPTIEERLQLWKNAFSGTCTLHQDIDLNEIAAKYELTGGSIINVLRSCALSTIRRNERLVTKDDFMKGLTTELKREMSI